MEPVQIGRLKAAYRGHWQVEFVEHSGYQIIVKLCGSGLEVEIYSDEVVWED